MLHSQEVVQNIKNKFGVQLNGDWIVPPKFDSIYASSSNHYTAYKKSKVFYFNSKGDRFFKTKINENTFGDRFNRGYAFVKKKQLWGAIGINGEIVVPYSYNLKPTMVGSIAVFSRKSLYSTKVDLYGANYQGLGKYYDSTKVLKNLILAFASKTETKRVKRKIIGTKKVTVDNLWTNFFDINSSTLIGKYKGHDCIQIGRMIQVVDENNNNVLLNSKGEVLVAALNKTEQAPDGNFFIYLNPSPQTDYKSFVYLLDSSGKIIIEHKGYSRFLFNDKSIYAYYDARRVDIYSKSYELITANVRFKSYKINNWNVFQDDNGWYLGDETGVRKTNYYSKINKASNDMILIQRDSSFGYLNLSNLTETKFYPTLTGINYRYGRTGRGIMKLFGSSYRTETWEVLFDGRPYREGYAVIALNAHNKPLQKGRSLDIGDETKLRYNYIDKKGNLFSKDKFKALYPFKNGKAWVYKSSYFYLIDTNGKADYSIKAEEIDDIGSDHFLFKKNGDWGIVDNNYKVVVEPTYFHRPYVVDGKVILKNSGDKPDDFYILPPEN